MTAIILSTKLMRRQVRRVEGGVAECYGGRGEKSSLQA